MISDDKKQVIEFFNEGRKYYKMMQFAEARKCFAKAIKIDPDDGPAKVYYKRCEHYIENPPPDDWDGVFVMKTK